MKTIITFLKPYRIQIIIAYALTLVELAGELLFPLMLGMMINEGIATGNMDRVLYWGTIMLAITIITFLAGIINSYYSSHVSVFLAYNLREKLFHKIQQFTFHTLHHYPTSTLVTRFTNDVRQIQNTVFMALRIMFKAPLIIIGSILIAFFLNFKISLIFLLTVPLLSLFLLWALKKSGAMFGQIQAALDSVNKTLQENIGGMRIIRAFVRKDYETKRFEKANETLAVETRTAFRFVEATMPILLFVMNMSVLFILAIGHKQIMAGTTAVGDVVAIVNYALRTAMAISLFTFITLAFSRARASAKRVADILEEDGLEIITTSTRPNETISGKISFSNVSFSYDQTDVKTLNDISFTIEPKEKVAIIGATGSGKTTLFQLIPRLYDTTTGQIYIDDQPIEQFSLQALRQQIGYVPQVPLLFSGTITDNIAFGTDKATKDMIQAAAKDAQIHDTIEQFTNKYDTIVGQKGVNLSGGQKQRISIARALMRKPKILMLDDSTSALDLHTEAKLLSALEKYETTTLIITQKVATAKKADKIMLIDNGKVLAYDTHKALLQNNSLYKKIVASQLEKELQYVD